MVATQIEISALKWYCSMSSFNIFNKTPKKITVFLPNVAHHTFYTMIVSFFVLNKSKDKTRNNFFYSLKGVGEVWYSWDKNRGKFIRKILVT